MIDTELKANYAAKPAEYFGNVREEMVHFLPANATRVLDVGCGSGAFGALLKSTREVVVWGVEPCTSAAQTAARRLDHAVCGFFGPELRLPAGFFDCIVFNDVLEHLLDPAAAIRYARTLLSAGGVLVVSVPNIRHFPTIWHLVIHGRWEYGDAGILDRTHLRFFTKGSIKKLIEAEGFSVRQISGINMYRGDPNTSKRVWSAFRVFNLLLLRKFDDLKFLQFAVVAAKGRDDAAASVA